MVELFGVPIEISGIRVGGRMSVGGGHGGPRISLGGGVRIPTHSPYYQAPSHHGVPPAVAPGFQPGTSYRVEHDWDDISATRMHLRRATQAAFNGDAFSLQRESELIFRDSYGRIHLTEAQGKFTITGRGTVQIPPNPHGYTPEELRAAITQEVAALRQRQVQGTPPAQTTAPAQTQPAAAQAPASAQEIAGDTAQARGFADRIAELGRLTGPALTAEAAKLAADMKAGGGANNRYDLGHGLQHPVGGVTVNLGSGSRDAHSLARELSQQLGYSSARDAALEAAFASAGGAGRGAGRGGVAGAAPGAGGAAAAGAGAATPTADPDVQKAQAVLEALNLSTGEKNHRVAGSGQPNQPVPANQMDGIHGPMTREAVKKMQETLNRLNQGQQGWTDLPTDGKLDPHTKVAIETVGKPENRSRYPQLMRELGSAGQAPTPLTSAEQTELNSALGPIANNNNAVNLNDPKVRAFLQAMPFPSGTSIADRAEALDSLLAERGAARKDDGKLTIAELARGVAIMEAGGHGQAGAAREALEAQIGGVFTPQANLPNARLAQQAQGLPR